MYFLHGSWSHHATVNIIVGCCTDPAYACLMFFLFIVRWVQHLTRLPLVNFQLPSTPCFRWTYVECCLLALQRFPLNVGSVFFNVCRTTLALSTKNSRRAPGSDPQPGVLDSTPLEAGVVPLGLLYSTGRLYNINMNLTFIVGSTAVEPNNLAILHTSRLYCNYSRL